MPTDFVQPWEQLDANGKVVAGINADSGFLCGVERVYDSGASVSDSGEVVHLESGDAGSAGMSWVMYRLLMEGAQPGVVSADVNLGEMSDGGLSEYYVGLSNYGEGVWDWYGPFNDSHVRLSTGADVADGADYLSDLGNHFVTIVAFDGAVFDVVGVGTNAYEPADTEAPTVPMGLIAEPVYGGLDLNWNDVLADDLAGYRVYYSNADFTVSTDVEVNHVSYLIGQGSYLLTGLTGTTYIRVSAVDISGNESAMCDSANQTPLAGLGPELRLGVNASSGLINENITLTATGAVNYAWDLDGNGVYEITGDTTGMQPVYTGNSGIIRPRVRGTTDDGSCAACGAVSLIITSNSRPVANAYASPTTGEVPLLVYLDGTGEDDDGTLVSYSWDFDGDGVYDQTLAVAPNPIAYTYNIAGLYNAKFRVEDDQGSWDVDTVAVQVIPMAAADNSAPTAVIAIGAGEESGEIPHNVHFDASGSSDPDEPRGDTIVRYWWDLDGDSLFEGSTTSPLFFHTYLECGVYDATVMVEDSYGVTDSDSVEITVNVNGNVIPVAALTVTPTYCDQGESVAFDASGSIDADGHIVSYEWDFECDGMYDEYGSADTTSHTYSNFGVYLAKVRVTDDVGAQDTARVVVRVNEVLNLTHPWPCARRDSRNTGRSTYVGAQSSNFKWAYTTGQVIVSSIAVAADGTVYVGGRDFNLYAINPDGTLKWSFPTADEVRSSPAIGTDGTVYIGSRDSKLYAVSPAGVLVWEYTTAGEIDSSPAVAEDGTIYVGSFDGKLHAINPDGSSKWAYTTSHSISSSPAIGPDGTVYIGSWDHHLYAVNPDATLKWSFPTGSIIDSSPAVDVDGTVYVGSDNGKLYALNSAGTEKWFYQTGSFIRSTPTIGADGTVYVGSWDFDFYALHPDGTLRWSFTTGGKVDSSGAIGADGTIYVGSGGGKLYAFNPDGSELWSYAMGGYLHSSPAIAPDGTVYIGSWNRKLYAIGPTT